MPREQIQRLNKTPGTEVQAGVLQSGVTQTSNMGYVQQQKTSGQRLAESLGMAVNVGTKLATKGMELYQGQKKEEAANRIAKEQYQWMDEMNNLPSDTDRVRYIRGKVQEVSNDGVDKYYREGLLGFFDAHYNVYSKGSYEEGQVALNNQAGNLFLSNIRTNGTADYESVLKQFPTLEKKRVHKKYAEAIKVAAISDIQAVRTPEDLKTIKSKIDTVLSEYNSNVYAGGSNSIEAQDIKNDLYTSYNTVLNSVNKKFKEDYQVQKALIERDFSMTPEAYAKFIKSSEYQDRSEAIKSITEYTKNYTEFKDLETYDNQFEVDNPTNNANYDMLSDKKKKINKEKVSKNITYGLEAGAYTSLVSTVSNNIKASDSIIKGFFNTNTTSPEFLNKQLTAFKGLKNTRDGDIVLYGMNKNDRVALEILSVYPETEPQMIREVLNSELIKDGQYGDKNKYYKDWQKVIAKLSPKDAEIANSLRAYVFNTNGRDPKASIDFVKENFVPSVSKDISGVKFLGRVEETKAEALKGTIDTVFNGFTYDTVEVLDDGRIRLFESSTPFVSATVTETDLNKAQGGILAAEQISKKLDTVITENADLTSGVSSDVITEIKNGFIGFYKNNSDIIGTLETEGATPDVITKIKDGFKSWSNRVNGTDFKLSTDSNYNESTVQVDNVVEKVIDAIGPTKAYGSEIKTLFSNVKTINDSSTGITQDTFLATNYNAASKKEQQIWLSNANRQVETPRMRNNLTAVENIVDTTKAYDATLSKYNISKDELKAAIKKVYSAETHYGTSPSKVSDTGALGELQVLVSTARDLTKPGKQYFGSKAAKEANINLDKFNKDEAYAKDVLLNNKKANVLFAIAKILSSYKSTQLKGE